MPRGMNPVEHNEPNDDFIGPKNRDRGIRKNRVELWAVTPKPVPAPAPEVKLPKLHHNRPEIPSVSVEKARQVSVVQKRRTRSEKAAQRLSRATARAQGQSDKQRKQK